ncbi:MAG: YggS family pyridoxal phosphate-dependent enzyme [Bacteroidaceae bacterium]
MKKENKIVQHINQILEEIPSSTRLVAVSKYHTVDEIQQAYDGGQRLFGENKVQELLVKYEKLPYPDIQWHMIGHLQRNKVKYIAPFVAMIHAVDTFKLLQEIDKQATACNRVIPVLLEVHVAEEDSKYGFSINKLMSMFAERQWTFLKHVSICGIMGMASHTDNEQRIRQDFKQLAVCFKEIKQIYFCEESGQKNSFSELSMGMTNDYLLAVKEGSTLVRIGSGIFGKPQMTVNNSL